MTKTDTKKTVKKVVTTAGRVGRVLFGGAMIFAHATLSAVGALLCAITKE